MDPLKQKFFEKSNALRNELKTLLAENGELSAGSVTLNQIFGGARGIKMMLWETSELDAMEGIRFRGYSIPELRRLLPREPNGIEPKPEGLFWLMLVGEIPTDEEVAWLTDQFRHRSNVPEHVFNAIESLPADAHPMSQFVVAITALQTESIFARRYNEGMKKSEYWDATYEDALNLIAKLPRVAAYIYRRSFHGNKQILPDLSLDWAANYAHMLGIDNPTFKSLMRLYMTIHADHEGGNASAHTTFLVGSTLADPYLSFSAAMCALAGPLHGLANQEVIKWIFKMVDAIGTKHPTKEQIAEYVKSTLAGGQDVPGYGHAVLRRPDPRFTAQMDFAQQHLANDPMVKIVWKVFEVVPEILSATGKVKNPWPNVDAHSGALLVHYGMKEYSYYTVMFGVSRALGVMAALVWARALGIPIERPKSVTSDWMKDFVAKAGAVVDNGD